MTPYEVAEIYNGIKERPGAEHHPAILSFFEATDGADWVDDDETPWCSAFVYFCAKACQCDRPMSYQLRARSWLRAGAEIEPHELRVGWDLVIFKRGRDPQPGPERTDAPGHVGFYSGQRDQWIYVLGGNQGNSVCTSSYPRSALLGCRRLVRIVS